MNDMVSCPACGSENLPSSMGCVRCGAHLHTPEEPVNKVLLAQPFTAAGAVGSAVRVTMRNLWRFVGLFLLCGAPSLVLLFAFGRGDLAAGPIASFEAEDPLSGGPMLLLCVLGGTFTLIAYGAIFHATVRSLAPPLCADDDQRPGGVSSTLSGRRGVHSELRGGRGRLPPADHSRHSVAADALPCAPGDDLRTWRRRCTTEKCPAHERSPRDHLSVAAPRVCRVDRILVCGGLRRVSSIVCRW